MRETSSIPRSSGNEIAIIGMSGRFPGASNTQQFWHNVSKGDESIHFPSLAERSRTVPVSADRSSGRYVPAVAMMDGIEEFDAPFFEISPKEAELMDPQHRVFLEECWTALESAGYGGNRGDLSVGVFAGTTINTYLLMNILPSSRAALLDPLFLNVASACDFLTTRISYKLNLTGPSHVVQCACSTSLVAVHAACQSLLGQECDLALAGGVSINLQLLDGYAHLAGGVLSEDGHCRPFDQAATGTVFGGGVGVVVLRRLADALADRDPIRAVILGSAINNDGNFKVGYTAPSVDGQAAVITEALANAGVPPSSIGYIETHGTGTVLGDAVEVQALKRAFREVQPGFACPIGSVKAQVGHLDAAAGVTGLIKTALALEHRQLPPAPYLKRQHQQLDNSPFFVNTSLRPWAVAGPRRAGVSAFGVGGTNAHVVVEEAPEAQASTTHRRTRLLTLSARTDDALKKAASRLATFLESNPKIDLADVAYTLHVGRAAFPHRFALACSTPEEAVARLRAEARQSPAASAEACRPLLAFYFSGSGTIDPRSLAAEEPSFAARLEQSGMNGAEQAAASQIFLAETLHSFGFSPDAAFATGPGLYLAAAFSHVLPANAAAAAVALATSSRATQERGFGLLAQRFRALELSAPSVPIYRGDGTPITEQEALNPEFWINCLLAPRESAATCSFPSTHVTLSLGGATLSSYWAGTMISSANAFTQPAELMRVIGELWELGLEPDWQAIHQHDRCARVPLPTYPFERHRYWVEPSPQSPRDDETSKAQTQKHVRPDLGHPFVGPENDLELRMKQIWEDVLAIEGIGVEDSFFDLGGDSLLAVEVADRIKRTIAVEVPAATMYDCLTIRSLAQTLVGGAERPVVQRPAQDPQITRRLRFQEARREHRASIATPEPKT